MKIRIIDFGLPENHRPLRSHANDAGADVYMKRNRYMVGQADRVIAVYDGREKGGTVSTIRMVHAQRKEMREIPVGPYLPESMINLGYFRNTSGRQEFVSVVKLET